MTKRIVIASGKGGVGKTTLCIGIAKALCGMQNKVLILDFDNLRSVDLMLGEDREIVFDWGDVVKERCALDDAIRQTKDVAFMACPRDYQGITPQDIRRLTQTLSERFDYILFDAPAGIGEALTLACAAAQKAIVVATPDLVSVRAACRAAQEITSRGVEETRLVINRAVRRDIRHKRLLNIDAVIDGTGVQLLGMVPEDKALRRCAMQGNILRPQQLSYVSFCNIARRLMGERIPLTIV